MKSGALNFGLAASFATRVVVPTLLATLVFVAVSDDLAKRNRAAFERRRDTASTAYLMRSELQDVSVAGPGATLWLAFVLWQRGPAKQADPHRWRRPGMHAFNCVMGAGVAGLALPMLHACFYLGQIYRPLDAGGVRDPIPRATFEWIRGSLVAGAGLAFVGGVVWFLAWRWRYREEYRRLARGEELCPGCGYPLKGLSSQRCPECGEPIAQSEADVERGP